MTARGREVGGKQKGAAGNAGSVTPATPPAPGRDTADDKDAKSDIAPEDVEEIGGPKGPEPTRFGDWEKGGRCSDF